ncbi:MAG TPA: hypothetical protein VMC80_01125 [Patescibacteria group bacterium]|nr:hypothetical protein [Patescibacteria group bacterium]
MGLKGILQKYRTTRDLANFQTLQGEYDRRFFPDKLSGFNKIRHTYAHMGKLMGRLAEYIHDVEETGSASNASTRDVVTKVIPDLLVYSAWLAQEFNVDIGRAYLRRVIGNIKRLHADKISPGELGELEKEIEKLHV